MSEETKTPETLETEALEQAPVPSTRAERMEAVAAKKQPDPVPSAPEPEETEEPEETTEPEAPKPPEIKKADYYNQLAKKDTEIRTLKQQLTQIQQGSISQEKLVEYARANPIDLLRRCGVPVERILTDYLATNPEGVAAPQSEPVKPQVDPQTKEELAAVKREVEALRKQNLDNLYQAAYRNVDQAIVPDSHPYTAHYREHPVSVKLPDGRLQNYSNSIELTMAYAEDYHQQTGRVPDVTELVANVEKWLANYDNQMRYRQSTPEPDITPEPEEQPRPVKTLNNRLQKNKAGNTRPLTREERMARLASKS